MLSLNPYRFSKPYFFLACLLTALFILFAPFTSHGNETRQALVGMVGKVKSKSAAGGWGAEMVFSEEEEAMREWELRRAIQHEGTSARMQAFLDKARSGQPFTVSVIGGSVSKGRGLTPPSARPVDLGRRIPIPAPAADDADVNADITEVSPSHPLAPLAHLGASTLYSPENLHMMIFDFLNETFPNAGNRFVNGAQGGVGAGYFGWCFKEHIPEDSDLVLVELGINDLLEIESISSYEHLLRGVLELETKPAVINIETFTTLFPSLISSSTFHLDLLQFYDIPSIAIRDVLLPRILADPERQMPRWFRTGDDVAMGDPKVREFGGVAVDVMHISALGHGLAAGLAIRYLEEQIARNVPRRAGAFGFKASRVALKPILRIMDIPAASLTGSWNPYEPHVKHTPVCRSQNSAKKHGSVSSKSDDLADEEGLVGLNPNQGSHGWSQWSWKEKRYLVARDPGSIVLFDFIIAPPEEIDPAGDDEASQLIAELVEPVGRRQSRPAPAPAYEIDTSLPSASASEATADDPDPLSTPLAIEEGEVRRWLHRPNKRQSAQAGGSVLIGYQRSAKLGLGSVLCWVDDERDSATQVDGWWKLDKRNMGMVKEIAHGLPPGPHTLHCELLKDTLDPNGGTEFRLFAVMHD